MDQMYCRIQSYEPLWGQWRLGEVLYKASDSCVYELLRERVGESVVSVVKIKYISLPEAGGNFSTGGLEEELREIQAMEKLADCPYIVSVKEDSLIPVLNDSGETVGFDLLIRMDRLDCLSDMIRDDRSFSSEEIFEIGRDLCRGLSFIHSSGYLHRDIKPSNIYRNSAGIWQLGDLGTAKNQTEEDSLRTIAGTKAYMAPEVALGEDYDERADLYSLGIVLYQLMNGNSLPFMNPDASYSQRKEAISKRLKGASLPDPVQKNKRLISAIKKACSTRQEQRYANAESFGAALEQSSPKGKKCVFLLLCLLFFLMGAAVMWIFPIKQFFLQNGSMEPGDMISASGSKYQLILSSVTWEDARVWCQSRGGHLVTVTSREEENKILELLEKNRVSAVWIGASDLNPTKGYQWLTDEPFSYAAWGFGEPNHTNGTEHYLMLMKKDADWIWNDSSINGLSLFPSGTAGFICEWDN